MPPKHLKILVSGCAFLILLSTASLTQLGRWEHHDSARYLVYFGIALLSFSLQVRTPSIAGTTSMGFVFFIVALGDLRLQEILHVAGFALIVQSVWRKRGDNSLLELFSALLSADCAILTSQLVYGTASLAGPGVDMPVRLVLAACGCFVGANLPMALVAAVTERKPMKEALAACHFWSFPFYLAAAALAAVAGHFNITGTWQVALIVPPATYLLYRFYRLYANRLTDQKRQGDAMASLNLRTIEALAGAIEAKDEHHRDCPRRVAVYAVELGKHFRMSAEELAALHAAALLHNIGKLAVPDSIIYKPGRLTAEEFEKVKTHPVVGEAILERVGFPYPVVPLVRAQHEQWDGCGYPDGLKGEQIPLGARILTAVVCLDALASPRADRPALPLERAVRTVVEEAGTVLDPRVVEVLAAHYPEWETKASGGTVQKPRQSSVAVVTENVLRTISLAREEVQYLLELTQDLGTSLRLSDTFAVLGMGLKRLVGYETLVVYVRVADRLVPQHVGGDHLSLYSALRIPWGVGVSGWVAGNGKPAINGDPSLEFAYLKGQVGPMRLQSALAVPLNGSKGVFGALALYRSRPNAFTHDDLRLVLAVELKASQAIENGLQFKEAEDSATTDFLTGLPNAHSLFLQLDRELSLSRSLGAPVAIVVCDLDGFKQVNDRFGHATGNEVLKAVAQSMRQSCRGSDYVARMGGDEFVLIFPGIPADIIQAKLKQLRAAVVAAGAEICGEPVVDGSFGVAFHPANGSTPDELLAEADRQMYHVKELSKLGVTDPPANLRVMPKRRSAAAG